MLVIKEKILECIFFFKKIGNSIKTVSWCEDYLVKPTEQNLESNTHSVHPISHYSCVYILSWNLRSVSVFITHHHYQIKKNSS